MGVPAGFLASQAAASSVSLVPIWVSGSQYVIGQKVLSLLNYKEYTRKTTGAGTTDPSLDTTNWTSQNKNATNLIVRGFPATGMAITAIAGNAGGTSTQSGSTTAGVLKTIFSYSNGAGIMTQLTARTADVTSRTLRLKITIDGVSAYDNTSSAITTADRGFLISGVSSATSTFILPAITWANSILIEVASSLTESNGITVEYAYNGVA